jgi:hypothetical protein
VWFDLGELKTLLSGRQAVFAILQPVLSVRHNTFATFTD